MPNIDKIRDERLTEDFKMETIADYLQNGGAVGVNTVVLTTPTGSLSDEDYAKILKDNCVIVMSTQYFRKQYHASTLIDYAATPRVGVGKIIFDYIEIDRETQDYELKHEEYSAG